MAKISPLDVLYITIIKHGTTCLNTCVTGLRSLSDIIAHARRNVPDLSGMTTLSVRNTTEGWTARQSVFIR